jgi:hypothetical protein
MVENKFSKIEGHIVLLIQQIEKAEALPSAPQRDGLAVVLGSRCNARKALHVRATKFY